MVYNLTRTFPEQLEIWVCSAGTRYFCAPKDLNKENLLRWKYGTDRIHTVGNSVVDAIDITGRKEKPHSVFDLYQMLEFGEWIRVVIHGKENTIKRRFTQRFRHYRLW